MSAAGNADLFNTNKGGAGGEEVKASQLDALLAKASQYSEFIRNSQDTATSSFYMHARKEMGIAEPAAAAAADGGKKKKQKREGVEGGAAAEEAAAAEERKDAEVLVWQPEALKGALKNYQLEGLRWMATLYENGLSGILADEMGLGKTIQIISLIAYLHEKSVQGPFIIAAPLATLPNWIKEFKKWLPKVETLLYHGSRPEREAMRRMYMPLERKSGKKSKKGAGGEQKRFPIIITSYEICIIDR
jgi:ATP-dependent DNA helicase